MEPHPLVTPFVGLLGAWVGTGSGQLPGEEPFTWRERLTVITAGTPAIAFSQRTRRPDGSPFHAEDGWVRVPPELQTDDPVRAVELAVTSPTGILEALDGTLRVTERGCELDAGSATLARTTAARQVDATRRRWVLEDDTLVIDFWMATPNHPELFHHLTVELHRDLGDTP